MKLKTVSIIGGGRLSKQFLPEIIKGDYVVGVDRGAYWLIQHGIVPGIAIGDFDSVNARELQIIKKSSKRVKEYPKEKDATDMELAVNHALSLHPKEVAIYGAIGTRLDHTLANVHLLERLGSIGVIRDANNEVRLVSKRLVLHKQQHYHYVSVLPMRETMDITLTGFLYNVFHVTISRGQTLGVSNQIQEEEAVIEVHRGKALVIRSRD